MSEYIGRTTLTSKLPVEARALESDPITSASPPVAMNGVASDATKSIFFFSEIFKFVSLFLTVLGFAATFSVSSGFTDVFAAVEAFTVLFAVVGFDAEAVFVVADFFSAIVFPPFGIFKLANLY